MAGLAARRSALMVGLAVRGRSPCRARSTPPSLHHDFGLVIAAMVYAGQAEVLALGGLALLVFLVVLLVQRLPGLGGSGPIGRPVLDLSARRRWPASPSVLRSSCPVFRSCRDRSGPFQVEIRRRS